MKLIVMLLGLLMVAPALSQKSCHMTEHKALFHIYNTSVEIDTYYCFADVEKDFQCEKVNAEVATVIPDVANRYCPLPRNGSHLKRVFCKLPGQVNLSNNTVVLADNTICQYNKYNCNDTSISNVTFWTNKNLCQYPLTAYKGKFDVWTIEENPSSLIKNGQIGLVLRKEIRYCGIDVWKTNYEGVIASKADLKFSIYRSYSDFKQNFTKISKRICEPSSLEPIPRTWYIYRTNVTIYTCLGNSSSSCQGMIEPPKYDAQFLQLCKKACDSLSCKPNSKLCKRTHHVNFRNNAVIGLPKCKYSDGVCKSSRAFWYYTDRCGNVQKAYEAYEEPCGGKKCVNQPDKGISLTLERKGKLCDEIVWYTDQLGLVASEKELGFIRSKSRVLEGKKQWDSSWFRLELDSTEILESGKYYLIVPLAICVFGIVVKLTVCPVFLCTKCKKPNKPI